MLALPALSRRVHANWGKCEPMASLYNARCRRVSVLAIGPASGEQPRSNSFSGGTDRQLVTPRQFSRTSECTVAPALC